MRQVPPGASQAIVVRTVDDLGPPTRPELEASPPLDATVILESLEPQAQEIIHPDSDRRRIHLRPFRLEPSMDFVVWFSFHGLQVELSRDLHRRLHAQTVHL